MARSEIWSISRRLMEESRTSGCSSENGGGAAGSMRRRRRMEIRRIKMLTNAAHPVSVRRLGEGNESANPGEIVGINSSDRMSSGGSSGSAQDSVEESDVSSSLTSVGGGFQGALGNESLVTTRQVSSGASPHVLPTKTVAALEESLGVLATMGPAESCGTADMSSTATDSMAIGLVDNRHLEITPPVAYRPQQDWQRSGDVKESIPESSAAATTGDLASAEGSGVPASCFASNECPSHGMVSLCGRRREMEDAVVSKDSFAVLPCNKVGGCDAAGLESAPLHYFGVYDGHGGHSPTVLVPEEMILHDLHVGILPQSVEVLQAANFCAERLHHALAEEVESCFVQGQNDDQTTSDWESKWLTAMTQCFKRMDAEVGGFCLEEGECPASENPRCCPEPIAPETVGTTAIVAVVGACQIIIGNCGDSRAVLSRGGVAIPLSVDHKPEREDEMARVEAAGGRVIYWNGYRVLGVLAMSRAIGDRYLKPYVIAEPEVKCIKRAEDDECLILASDGLWDVMSNEVVCDIARKTLSFRRNGQPPSASTAAAAAAAPGAAGTTAAAAIAETSSTMEESPAAQAAAVLVKLALAKGSSDNISVVVIDLKAPSRR